MSIIFPRHITFSPSLEHGTTSLGRYTVFKDDADDRVSGYVVLLPGFLLSTKLRDDDCYLQTISIGSKSGVWVNLVQIAMWIKNGVLGSL